LTASTGKYAKRRGGLEGQFWHSVLPEPNSGCWLWAGTVSRVGYGTMTRHRQTFKAHRVAFEMFCDPIPDGAHVLHRCDVRSCVNPDHLFLGTNADNVRDKVSKGRQAKGEGAGLAKLTESSVRAIRADTGSTRELAIKYGVGKSTTACILAGKSWKHVA
jgi:hypothetical protein